MSETTDRIKAETQGRDSRQRIKAKTQGRESRLKTERA